MTEFLSDGLIMVLNQQRPAKHLSLVLDGLCCIIKMCTYHFEDCWVDIRLGYFELLQVSFYSAHIEPVKHQIKYI